MDIGKVFVDSVIVGPRHRALDAGKIEALAESMDALGLQQPISVFMDDEDGAHLIAGLHRLEAARALKWEQIPASFVSLDPARREMWEIAENLFRVDLSKEQRDEHIRRYAELLATADADDGDRSDKMSGQSLADGRKAGPQHQKGIASQIAEQTGISTRTVQRALNPEKTAARSKIDADVKARAAREVAEMISEHVPGEWWDALKANLYAAGAANIAHELTNITGQSIMDRRFG